MSKTFFSCFFQEVKARWKNYRTASMLRTAASKELEDSNFVLSSPLTGVDCLFLSCMCTSSDRFKQSADGSVRVEEKTTVNRPF